ncbi:MAG: hypothetical protein WC956_04390 [bacterium]
MSVIARFFDIGTVLPADSGALISDAPLADEPPVSAEESSADEMLQAGQMLRDAFCSGPSLVALFGRADPELESVAAVQLMRDGGRKNRSPQEASSAFAFASASESPSDAPAEKNRSMLFARPSRQKTLPSGTSEDVFQPRPSVPDREVFIAELAHDLALFRKDQGRRGNADALADSLRALERSLDVLMLDSLPFEAYERNKLIVLYNLDYLITNLQKIKSFSPERLDFIRRLSVSLGEDFFKEVLQRRDISTFLDALSSISFAPAEKMFTAISHCYPQETIIETIGPERIRDLCFNDFATAMKLARLGLKTIAIYVEDFGVEDALSIIRRLPVNAAIALAGLLRNKDIRQIVDIIGQDNFKKWVAADPMNARKELSGFFDEEKVPFESHIDELRDSFLAVNAIAPHFVEALLVGGDLFSSSFYDSCWRQDLCEYLQDSDIERIARADPDAFIETVVDSNMYEHESDYVDADLGERLHLHEEYGDFDEFTKMGRTLAIFATKASPSAISQVYNLYHGADRPLLISRLRETVGRYADRIVKQTLYNPFLTSASVQDTLKEIKGMPDEFVSYFWERLREQSQLLISVSDRIRLAVFIGWCYGRGLLPSRSKYSEAEAVGAILDVLYLDVQAYYESRLSSLPQFLNLLPITSKVQVGGPVTVAGVREIAQGLGIEISDLEGYIAKRYRIAPDGTILPLRPAPLASYRGSREEDDPNAQYLTYSPAVAFRYGIRGGEAAKGKGFEGVYEVKMPERRLFIDSNVALAYTVKPDELLRKRFVRISGDPSVGHLKALETTQVKEAAVTAEMLSRVSLLSSAKSPAEFTGMVDGIVASLRTLSENGQKKEIHDNKVRIDKCAEIIQLLERVETRYARYYRLLKNVGPEVLLEMNRNLVAKALADVEKAGIIIGLPGLSADDFLERIIELRYEFIEEAEQRKDAIADLLEKEEFIPWENEYAEHVFVTLNGGVSIFDISEQAKNLAQSDIKSAASLITKSGTMRFLISEQRQTDNFRRWERHLFGLN